MAFPTALTPAMESDIRGALAQLKAAGDSDVVVIETTSADLPWIIFRAPTLRNLSEYTATARHDPLMASIGLARVLAVAVPFELEAAIARIPFVVKRAADTVLQQYGLGASAQKKSLI